MDKLTVQKGDFDSESQIYRWYVYWHGTRFAFFIETIWSYLKQTVKIAWVWNLEHLHVIVLLQFPVAMIHRSDKKIVTIFCIQIYVNIWTSQTGLQLILQQSEIKFNGIAYLHNATVIISISCDHVYIEKNCYEQGKDRHHDYFISNQIKLC